MQNEKILEILYGDRKEYKGTKIMRELLENNEEFRNTIIEGIKTDNIKSWSEELWEKLERQNVIGRKGSIPDIYKVGDNIGDCTNCATQISFSFPVGCLYVGGNVDYLKGTKNSEHGQHTWIEYNGVIYDTTFMIAINEKYSKKLKYNIVYKSDPNKSSYYSVSKETANDPGLNTGRKR